MLDPLLLDQLAANATAPRTVRVVDGWQLRAAPELPFRRSNAVVPLRGSGAPELDTLARLEVVERFYRDRGLRPRFQISPSSWPRDLDEILEGRSYVVDSPVDMLVARATRVIAAVGTSRLPRARLREGLDPEWAAAYGGPDAASDDQRTSARLHAYRELLNGIRLRSVIATVDDDSRPVAVGFGVVERGHMGIFGMATRVDCRRRGAGRAVLGALARCAHDQGAPNLYLQMEVDNDPARALYRSVGFEANHGYHYRVLA